MPADYLRRGGHGRGNTRGAGVEVVDGGVSSKALTRVPFPLDDCEALWKWVVRCWLTVISFESRQEMPKVTVTQ